MSAISKTQVSLDVDTKRGSVCFSYCLAPSDYCTTVLLMDLVNMLSYNLHVFVHLEYCTLL